MSQTFFKIFSLFYQHPWQPELTPHYTLIFHLTQFSVAPLSNHKNRVYQVYQRSEDEVQVSTSPV